MELVLLLLQEGRPIEYASRALTPSERNWAQIEKEALAVLYGLERFDQYAYGRAVTVQNDQKPLAAILRKPLSMAPKRLQDIMMRYNRYDVNFVFVKGTSLHIADTLSRAHLDSVEGNQDDPTRTTNIYAFAEIPDKRLDEIRAATLRDTSLQTVIKLVLDGWPQDKHNIPSQALPYFDMRDSLSKVDGILVKGEAIVIPSELRASINLLFSTVVVFLVLHSNKSTLLLLLHASKEALINSLCVAIFSSSVVFQRAVLLSSLRS